MILWNDFKRFSSQIKLSLVLRRCSFQISFQPFLSVCPVTIIRFQIQTWIVPGRCITQIIFWEMVFPNILFVFSFYLRNRDILLPMMSPEELRLLREDHNIIPTLFGKLFKIEVFKGQTWKQKYNTCPLCFGWRCFPSWRIHIQYNSETTMATNPNTSVTIPIFLQ